MSVRINRHLGPANTLDAKQWTDRTASGLPAICCPGCAAVADLSPVYSVNAQSGRVGPGRWSCDGCSFRDYIELEAFGEDVLT